MTRQCAGCPQARRRGGSTTGPFRIIKIFLPERTVVLVSAISPRAAFGRFPALTSDPDSAGVTLPSLVDVFEEDPVVEAAALGALATRFRHDVLPADAMSSGESLQYFQDVGQFRGQLPVRRRLRFMRLLQQLHARPGQYRPADRPSSAPL